MSKFTKNLILSLISSVTLLGGCTSQNDKAEILGSRETSYKAESDESEQNELEQQKDLYVSFSMVATKLVRHQPVLVEFRVKNDLQQPVEMDLGYHRKEGFVFTLVQPNGREVQIPQMKLQREGFGGSGIVRLDPKKSYSQRLVLNEWTDFSSQGKYLLKANLVNKIKTVDGKSTHIKPTSLMKFYIAGENVGELKAVCESLLKQILTDEGFDEKNQTALALIYVQDPISVPYLQQALTSNKSVEVIIINSLRERGGKESVDVLIGALKEKPKNWDFAASATSALRSIETKSSDLELKQRIRQFINI